ncbi:hypothetical protein Zm00014a_022991 [Zea mays]|jgi:hypothetical protein|uniref:Uncharacterized protein n=2 Tax=Zea mays TaxID=4577 RepID=B4G1V1_MAIZE|nr:uncharacterized protein LOC100274545 [Zea mays]ACF88344.1 unknown [Zea mays]AQK98350.1 hypothetical protein ZEAMMB73_Zm00001d011933 [Zea mays]PWZ11158.1 hypothetical protein Zm00014a_022991 [Zea mays]|eukprot:NP_001142373.1 uncharacterized protein LOC100274545 [Zea mays]
MAPPSKRQRHKEGARSTSRPFIGAHTRSGHGDDGHSCQGRVGYAPVGAGDCSAHSSALRGGCCIRPMPCCYTRYSLLCSSSQMPLELRMSAREVHHQLAVSLLALHWLLGWLRNLVPGLTHWFYPVVFDPLGLKGKKLDCLPYVATGVDGEKVAVTGRASEQLIRLKIWKIHFGNPLPTTTIFHCRHDLASLYGGMSQSHDAKPDGTTRRRS